MSSYNRTNHDTLSEDNKPLKHAFPKLHFTYTNRQKDLKNEIKRQKSFDQRIELPRNESTATSTTSAYLTPKLEATPKPSPIIKQHSFNSSYNPYEDSNHRISTTAPRESVFYQTSTAPLAIPKPSPIPVSNISPLTSSYGSPSRKVSPGYTARNFYGESVSPSKSSKSSSSSIHATNSNGSNEKMGSKPSYPDLSTSLYITKTSRSNSTAEKESQVVKKEAHFVKLREPTKVVSSRPPSTLFEPSPKTLPDYYQQKKTNPQQAQKRWQTVNFDTSQENRVAALQANILFDRAKNNEEVIKKQAEKKVEAKKPIFVADALTNIEDDDEDFKTFLKNIQQRKKDASESKNVEGALAGRQMENVQSVETLTKSATAQSNDHIYYEEIDIPFDETDEYSKITEFANELVDDIFSNLENIDIFGHVLQTRLENLNVDYDDVYTPFKVIPTISEDAKQFFTPRNSVE